MIDFEKDDLVSMWKLFSLGMGPQELIPTLTRTLGLMISQAPKKEYDTKKLLEDCLKDVKEKYLYYSDET